jgi:cyclopropane-fatty-acyl-phospholipid synthase
VVGLGQRSRPAGRDKLIGVTTMAVSSAAVSAADTLAPIVRALLGEPPPVRIELWDGSALGPSNGAGTLRFLSPDAFRRLMWSPNQLGLARAYVAGELDTDGDIFELTEALRGGLPEDLRGSVAQLPAIVRAARTLGVLGRPLPPPPQEARLRGGRHSKQRDAVAIQHHYDVGNDFYRLVLGPAMTYSCARFVDDSTDLTTAQALKHDLVCRKLGLDAMRGGRLLDVGCGWGSMAIHAASHYDVSVVGITISENQVAAGRERVAAAGLADRVEIRLQDYRDLDEPFDAISSIGMSEHVGRDNLDRYYEILRRALPPHGRLLNHAISKIGGSKLSRSSFIGRYVFPDGELIDVGDSVLSMERAGFEIRDVESLREHYVRTLRAWVAHLEGNWDEAVRLAGEARSRVWRLYMAGSAIGFADGGIGIHQVLGVVPAADGSSGMAPTREAFERRSTAPELTSP